MEVRAGDYAYVDEGERGVVVVPKEMAGEVVRMLVGFKDRDDRRVAGVKAGMSVIDADKFEG